MSPIYYPPGTAGSFSAGVSTDGNTAGSTGTVSNRVVLVGSANVTLSQSTNAGGATISISAAAGGGGGGASMGVSNLGNTAGNTTVQTGSRFVLVGAGAATLSQATGAGSTTVSISVPTQTTQTQNLHNVTLSGNTAGVMAQVSSGTLTLAGGNGITLSQNGNAVTVSGVTQSAQTQGIIAAGVSTGGNTAGNTTVQSGTRLVFEGGANVTLSQATAANATTIQIAAPAGGGGGVALNPSGTTITSGTASLVGAGNVTVTGNGQTITVSGSQSTAPSAIVASNSTYTSGSVVISGAGIVTVDNPAANSVRISASQSVQTQGVLSVGASTGGNTAGNTTVNTGSRMVLAGAGAVTLSQATAAGATTISVSAPTQTVQTQNLHNLTISGNTAGAGAAVSSGTLTLAGGNNITLSQAGNAITISAGAGGGGGNFSAGVSSLGNTAGSTGITGSQLVLVGNANVSLSQSTDANGATVSFDAPAAGGGGAQTLNYFNPQDAYVQVAGQQGQGSLHLQPMQAPNVTYDRVVFPVVFTGATNSTGSATMSLWMGIYTRNNSTFSLSTSYSTSVAVTHSGTANSTQNVGLKLVTMGATDSISEGQYYVGILSRTTSGGANLTVSQILASQANSNLSGFWGQAVTSSMQYTRGLGQYTATLSSLPASIGISQLSGTQSIVLRQPMFYLVNGTF